MKTPLHSLALVWKGFLTQGDPRCQKMIQTLGDCACFWRTCSLLTSTRKLLNLCTKKKDAAPDLWTDGKGFLARKKIAMHRNLLLANRTTAQIKSHFAFLNQALTLPFLNPFRWILLWKSQSFWQDCSLRCYLLLMNWQSFKQERRFFSNSPSKILREII